MKFEKKSMVQLFTIIFISEMIISRVDFNPLTERVLSGVIIDIIYVSVEFGLHGLFDPLESIFNNIFFLHLVLVLCLHILQHHITPTLQHLELMKISKFSDTLHLCYLRDHSYITSAIFFCDPPHIGAK